MTLLPGILLGNLQFDGFVGVGKPSEQRTDRFAHLKIDWPVFDLHDHVVVELSIEGMKVVIACPGAISFHIPPIQMIVVNESSVKNHATMTF